MVWEDSSNVTSAFQGITTPLADLYDQIHQRHWQVTDVSIKDGQYEATAKNPQGETVSQKGKDEKTALGSLLLHVVRKEYIRQGSWNQHWADQLEPIAKAYAQAPSFDPMAAAAWKELADDCVARAEQLKQQVHVEITDDPAPYSTPQELFEDVSKHQHLLVSQAASEHPVWTPEQVIAFRIVHDILGHSAAGGDFGWTGENLATAAHMPYLSPNAQRALFTETVGQRAYNHFYKGYGHPKITFLDEHLDKVQKDENPDGHGGLPVNHSLAPGVLPQRTATNIVDSYNVDSRWGEGGRDRKALLYHHPSDTLYVGQLNGSHGNIHDQFPEVLGKGYNMHSPDLTYGAYYPDKGYHLVYFSPDEKGMDQVLKNTLGTMTRREFNLAQPHDDADLWESHVNSSVWGWSKKANLKRDPNHGYQTGLEPIVDTPGAYGDPLNYHGLKDMGHMLNTGWAQWKDHNGEPDKERMKQAIINAFRVAILSPLKDLKWNAAHYQDISSIPYTVTDPKVYWDTLENSRIEYNRAQGIPDPEIQHKEHYRSGALLDFYRYYQAHHPEFNAMESKQAADREVMVLRAEIEERLMGESKDPDMDILEPKIDKQLNKALKTIVKDDQPLHMRSAIEDLPVTQDRYGGFIGRHLIAIARISLYADQLLESALEDVRNHSGSGHMFRAMALSLNIPFVGPKVASFAWLLLQPLTSQLATIDTHIGDVLGFKTDELPTRDYFRAERELQAGRDSSGYSHTPLGLFQWGMWDIRRHGQDQEHQDHSALKVWNPTPWQNIHWQPKVPKSKQQKAENWTPPEWWQATEPYRQNERAVWNTDVAPFHPQETIPWLNQPFMVNASSANEGTLFALGVPDNLTQHLAEWLSVLKDEAIEFVDPSDYHITVSKCEFIPVEVRSRLLKRFNPSGTKCVLSAINTFDNGAIVLEIESPTLVQQEADIREWIEAHGGKVSTHSSGFKPHITIGYGKLTGKYKLPPINFRAGSFVSSRPEDRFAKRVNVVSVDEQWEEPVVKAPESDVDPVWGPRKLTRRVLERLGLIKEAAPVYEHQTPQSSPSDTSRPFIYDGVALHLGQVGSRHQDVAAKGGFHYDWSSNRGAYTHGVVFPTNEVKIYKAMMSREENNIIDSLSKHIGQPLTKYVPYQALPQTQAQPIDLWSHEAKTADDFHLWPERYLVQRPSQDNGSSQQ